jgi:hypothetical protein
MMFNKKTLYFGLLAAGVAICVMGCGSLFKKADITGAAIEKVSNTNETALKGLGNKPIKDLTASEQKQAGDIIWDELTKIKWVKIAKQMCHAESLDTKDQCVENREKCLEEVEGETDEKVLAHLKSEESTIKAKLATMVAEADYSGEDILKVLKVLSEALSLAAEKLDCDSSKETVQNTINDFIAKNGGEVEFKRLKKIFKKFERIYDDAEKGGHTH